MTSNQHNRNQLNSQPSPWLNPTQTPKTHPSASFVEHLRWMRPYGDQSDTVRNGTKSQILQKSIDGANYHERLETLTQRTKLLAGEGNWFKATCAWRLRVGGHRGPESILLPAFDALGMPYIPSSTLRGVARAQAIRERMEQDGLSYKKAEKAISPWFGGLEAEASDQAGKVIFFDAYPSPSKTGGLAVDMANNIWSWSESGRELNYKPNPNTFLSLKDATFVIGIRATHRCVGDELEQVKHWLKAGLRAGIGAQINTGYGELNLPDETVEEPCPPFFSVKFELEGQLIHGQQKFNGWKWNDRNQSWKLDSQPEDETRPVAFKSMLRYWFKALALGVLEPSAVKDWEAKLFGSIQPQEWGWITVRIVDGKVVTSAARPHWNGKNDPCGQQAGQLLLLPSPSMPSGQADAISSLMTNLTWLMFHLGGVGQGARRPCYSRKTRERAPWWRGATLYPLDETEFWQLPDSVSEFAELFQNRLQAFYEALGALTGRSVNTSQPRYFGRPRRDFWLDAVDTNCQIVVCAGDPDFDKPFALATLHDKRFKREFKGRFNYDGYLCGKVGRDPQPSPVWIADLGDYQVVTVFGATQSPRRDFLEHLRHQAGRNNYRRVWPFI